MFVRVEHREQVVTISAAQQRQNHGEKQAPPLAEPGDKGMEGIDHDQGENKPGLDQVAALIRLPDIIDRYPEQKDDDHAFNFADLPVGIVTRLCIKITSHHKKQRRRDGRDKGQQPEDPVIVIIIVIPGVIDSEKGHRCHTA